MEWEESTNAFLQRNQSTLTAIMENLLNTWIKVIRTECGGEFSNLDFESFYSSHGILHHFSWPHTSQQNGVTERTLILTYHRNNTHSHLLVFHPLEYRPYAIASVVFLINRMPTPSLHFNTPWSRLFHSKKFWLSLFSFINYVFEILKTWALFHWICIFRLGSKC